MKNISELSLDDPSNIEICLKHWELLKLLSDDHIKIIDIKLEIEERWKYVGFNSDYLDVDKSVSFIDEYHNHESALRLNLIEDKTQKDSGELMKKAPRIVAKLVNEGVHLLARWGKNGQE